MRKKIIIGNWKMNLSLADAQDLVFKLKNQVKTKSAVEVAICPPYVYLLTLVNILKGSNIHICAQNMFHKENGAYTGEISPEMLTDLHVNMVIVGHSERRQYFHETDSDINLKIKSALKFSFTPIFCVGEDLKVRESGKAEEWVKRQILAGLKDLSKIDLEKIIVAYEPIWAIGTGKICSGEDANKIVKMIRETIKELSTNIVSEKVRILYGGSIKSDNFSEHIKYPDIDGGLVGGASLKFEEFAKIIDLADSVHALHQSHP
ncbi:MAG: triose-phosphate isomerase [Candidatus Melainabacteria bacterium]|nr:triose-phosphate isomerase [Candidatus Melainabacteria bacterium]